MIRTAALALIPLLAATEAAAAEPPRLEGPITPLNVHRIEGQSPEGRVRVTREGERIVFDIEAKGFTAGPHAVRIHGFATDEPRPANCPEVVADINRDGYIDAPELRERAGPALIPLNEDPAALDFSALPHPEAGPRGRLEWRKPVDAKKLEQALREKFGTPLALNARVVVFYGIPDTFRLLPNTVRAREGATVHESVPIACALLRAAPG